MIYNTCLSSICYNLFRAIQKLRRESYNYEQLARHGKLVLKIMFVPELDLPVSHRSPLYREKAPVTTVFVCCGNFSNSSRYIKLLPTRTVDCIIVDTVPANTTTQPQPPSVYVAFLSRRDVSFSGPFSARVLLSALPFPAVSTCSACVVQTFSLKCSFGVVS